MPNRREPVEPVMIDDMWELCKYLSIDSLQYALYNQNILGQIFGFCLYEQAQNEEDKGIYPKRAVDGTFLVFILIDFVFYGKNGVLISQGFDVTIRESTLESVEICQ